ncbi:alpha-D-ribose 1-methylphosphonate 5-triphosphate diphosphatase [Actibacterium sp. 188UL27-1]|uniref:alpha-D-ribose 1-methylphosphonate 5-triphosphate diphosphatase n=1 Tax=Actibacterium sp. 188UL27-1 TaxID=2786961 RepID=UPI00195C83BB|nr:alpha-D-ribose 1-methylphosphonate 5-triphosphate diphosphatase [Actibacterium sp. 188UL27-1]MBM7067397.1 alpha-D-ribose 1-methylphosphonate 5-triphosphate diphosphatase [Actibacterium sp. 188UL27-1]
MFDTTTAPNFRLTNARIVTPDGIHTGALSVENSQIGDLNFAAEGTDLEKDFLIPGIVDLHTDHVETHVFPRAGVIWDFDAALAAHDAVVISGGTTTVFDSLSVGASMQKPERRKLLLPLIKTLGMAAAEGRFRAEHLLHLRCEICDPDTMELVDQTMDHPLTRLASVMDHTPGDRQSVDVDKWLHHTAVEMQIDNAEAREKLTELLDRSARVGATVRAHVIAAAQKAGQPLMSHDDRTVAHIHEARDEGIAISEFPTTLDAAREARNCKQQVVVGAPNYLRGGSQSGNVAVADLLAAGVVDALASDYIPRSPLDAAFRIAEDPALPYDLPQAIALVSDAPAKMTGLTDRGRIAPGLRADLVRVRRRNGQNHVVSVWRAGLRVY